MSKLGVAVTYRAPPHHETETVIGNKTLKGSVYHPEATEFTGLVTRVHPDGTQDLVIFPPSRPPVHVGGTKADKDGIYSQPKPKEPKSD